MKQLEKQGADLAARAEQASDDKREAEDTIEGIHRRVADCKQEVTRLQGVMQQQYDKAQQAVSLDSAEAMRQQILEYSRQTRGSVHHGLEGQTDQHALNWKAVAENKDKLQKMVKECEQRAANRSLEEVQEAAAVAWARAHEVASAADQCT